MLGEAVQSWQRGRSDAEDIVEIYVSFQDGVFRVASAASVEVAKLGVEIPSVQPDGF
jgi:hypothetical protein